MFGCEIRLDEVAVEAPLITVMAGQICLECAHEIRIRLPGHRDRPSDDVPRNVDIGINLAQGVQHEPHPLVERQGAPLHRVVVPGIRQADHGASARAVVEQIGPARKPVRQGDDDAREAGTDHGDPGSTALGGQAAEARRMLQEIIVGKWKIGTEHRQGPLTGHGGPLTGHGAAYRPWRRSPEMAHGRVSA